MTEQLNTGAIAAAARSLVGVPFRHQGRDPQTGLDCAGLLVATFRLLGIELREGPADYHRLPAEAYIRECLALNFLQVPRVESLRRAEAAGQILHVKYDRDAEARHLGITTDGTHEMMIVHALRANRRIAEEPLRAVLANCSIAGVWSWQR